jgi:hypothetical protein
MTDYACLYFGPGDECQCCGGWVHADGCVPEGMPPLRLPNGSGIFCSPECVSAIEDLIAREKTT